MVEEGTLWVGLRLTWSWPGAVRPQGHSAGAVWGEGERARLVDEDVDALQVGDCRHLNAAAPHAALRHASAVGGHARARVPEDLCTSALARINRAAASTAYGCGLYHMHMHMHMHGPRYACSLRHACACACSCSLRCLWLARAQSFSGESEIVRVGLDSMKLATW